MNFYESINLNCNLELIQVNSSILEVLMLKRMYVKQKIIPLLIIFLSSQIVFCQNSSIKSGMDSTKNIKWIEVSYMPQFILKTEIKLDKSDLIMVLNCDTSLLHTVTPNEYPMHCYDELKVNRENSVVSSRYIFNDCIVNYFIKDKAKYKIDTIWVENEWIIEPVKIAGVKEVEATYFMSQSEFYSQDSSQYILSKFYKIDELKNECISEAFRKKSVEEWLNGKKHGKWKYWNKNGNKIREIEYDYGKKIKETIF